MFVSACAGNMHANALIDTGAILALLDRTDRWHRICVETFPSLRLPLITSEAVLTELFHVLGDDRREMESAWRFVLSGALDLAVISDGELPAVHALMSRYWDRPMDFADATLVHLAHREALSTVFTVDRADFETYRINGRRRFRVLPGSRP
jgi:predicted nucleic acid-binding protein